MAQSRKGAPGNPQAGAKNGEMRIDPSLVRELAELLTNNALTEIEVTDGDRRIRVARGHSPVLGATAAPAAPAAAATPPAAAQPAPQAAEAAVEEVAGTTIKSPMVGTAFLAPQPGASPFVEVGTAVKAGDTLLIVEAMKVMNPITAPAGGVVRKILVENAQPVEYDQPLMIIE